MTLTEVQNSLTAYLKAEDLKAAANVIVEARTEYFMDANGNPDYAGRTYAYRQWYGEAVDSLSLPADTRRKLLGKMRFHVGIALREAVPREALEDAGLQADSPNERNHRQYQARSKPYNVFSARKRLEDDQAKEAARLLAEFARHINPADLTSSTRIELREAIENLLDKLA